MKVLLYGLNYSPEVIGIGKYTGEMAQQLAGLGFEVRVVTAPPYYPKWEVPQGHSASRYVTEQHGLVKVWRCPLWVPKRVSGLTRIVHHVSFALFSLPVMLRQAFWRPDVVWVVAPSFMGTPAALLVARTSRAKAWLHIQDFELDAAFSLGILKNQALKNWALRLERWVMRRFDKVSTISLNMRQMLLNKGVSEQATEMLPNWVDIAHIGLPKDHPSVIALRKQFNIDESAVVCLYSGNMGAKQGLEILAEVSIICSKSEEPVASRLIFVFCGNGAGREQLEQACQGLAHVRFLDLQPLETLPSLLAIADIHLLPQRADAADLVMPSKLTGMLASGRPVVATAHADTELARVVNAELGAVTGQSLGLVVPPEQGPAMARAILDLACDPLSRQEMGKAARAFAEANLDKGSVLARFGAQLNLLVHGTDASKHVAINTHAVRDGQS
ncbi:glycosyltransferase WbuB [Curvibacter sp. HBC61]|uniref:Glycosyltransferase WbuB n=1 Tax=Curvibacter cyanobacteriorum TaxID=3026422 RepID=A0ABT5MZQ2_9BURK|nr:glycosyltransferase WbuB [Curvibacter sp. HBC61]MDD0838238.1 glycosyltransferase WbuB [Curvibacter sp. HBC61]